MKHTTASTNRCHPAAYTLIELIVVMAIILILAGLLIVMWPGLQSSTLATREADKIQAMLLIARQRAVRDGRPTGVRLVFPNPGAGNPSPSFGTISQLVYIQQPDPYTPSVGSQLLATSQSLPIAGSKSLGFASTVDFTGGQGVPPALKTDYLVEAAGTSSLGGASSLGDYLEINGGGMLQEIASVLQTSLSVADPVTLAVPTTNWRVIRQPRVLAGEEPLNLTNPIVIDLGTSSAPLSQNVPLRAAQSDRTIPPVFFREILFSPTGSVIGQGTASNDKIILWVHDGSLSDPTQGEPVLIAIQISTGFIGAYPVDIAAYNNNGDPYSNTHDPHASGL